MSRNKFNTLLLILVIAIAGYFRFWGTNPGYPPYHSDEGISYSAAVSMIKNGNLDPLRYDYPAVVPELNYLVFRYLFIPASWTKYYITNINGIVDGYVKLKPNSVEKKKLFQNEILGERDRNALFWGRYTTAFIGLLSVFLVYEIGKRLESKDFGIIASALLAVNYRHVLNSHLGLPDIYNGFFLLLSFLTVLKLWKNPTGKNYILASIIAGLSFATKYQFFSFFPLLTVHLYNSFSKPQLRDKITTLFRKEAIGVPFIILFVFILLNPYMFLKIEETIHWLISVSGKYRTGKNSFDFYPYSYLYHFGLGKEVFILTGVGILSSLVTRIKKSILILGIVIPFFYVTTFATGGGFYTRNFVSIIPFLMLLAAYPIYIIFSKFGNKIAKTLVSVFTIYVIFASSKFSLAVTKEYTMPWNFQLTEDWIKQNIPPDANFAAHSSVPLPRTINRLKYEQNIAFNLSEFRDEGADFAGENLDWVKVDYYWWMTQGTKSSLHYWNKPVDILNQMFATFSIRELAQYSIYSQLNNPRAPDSDFVISVVPKLSVNNKELISEYDFRKGTDGWNKYKTGADSDDILIFKDGGLQIGATSGVYLAAGWKSEPIDVSKYSGISLDYQMITKGAEGERDGYIVLLFYDNDSDLKADKPSFITMSSRNYVGGVNKLSVSSIVPSSSKYLVMKYQEYQYSKFSSILFGVKLYSADVNLDYKGYQISPIELSPTQLFPESHGNL